MTDPNEDGTDDMMEIIERSKRQQAERLNAAKVEATKRGKEQFDLHALEQMCDTTHEGRLGPVEERINEFEWKYYVDYPDLMTLAEFANKVDELSRW